MRAGIICNHPILLEYDLNEIIPLIETALVIEG